MVWLRIPEAKVNPVGRAHKLAPRWKEAVIKRRLLTNTCQLEGTGRGQHVYNVKMLRRRTLGETLETQQPSAEPSKWQITLLPDPVDPQGGEEAPEQQDAKELLSLVMLVEDLKQKSATPRASYKLSRIKKDLRQVIDGHERNSELQKRIAPVRDLESLRIVMDDIIQAPHNWLKVRPTQSRSTRAPGRR